jgi:hypothetical protein
VERVETVINGHEFEPGPAAAMVDLDTLVAEVGASYPLLAYTTPTSDDEDETGVLDSMILAGLVTP